MKKRGGQKEIQNQTSICEATVVVAESAVVGFVEEVEDLENVETSRETDLAYNDNQPRAGVVCKEGRGQPQTGEPSVVLGSWAHF